VIADFVNDQEPVAVDRVMHHFTITAWRCAASSISTRSAAVRKRV
jgi:hypothetical protein